MVYTRKGDEGRTDLFSGERVSKDSKRIEVVGTLDELNSMTGLAASKTREKKEELEKVQNQLHVLQAEVADREHEKKVGEEEVDWIEEKIDSYQEETPERHSFVLSGGAETAAFLDLARSIARRTERRVVALDNEEQLRSEVLSYINRLSDLYFVMARHENYMNDVEEKSPTY